MRFEIILSGILGLGVTAALAQPAVKLEPMAGGAAKRVILSPKAAQRLGIETAPVAVQPIVRRQMVSGLVVPPVSALPESKQIDASVSSNPWQLAVARPQPAAIRSPKAAAEAIANEAWVRVTLSPAEFERLAKDRPARLLPLATREALKQPELLARPSGMPPEEDSKRSMLTVHYVVKGADHGLDANRRMRVELELAGDEQRQKVVPYGAVYYDAKGLPWVYVNTQPLVYERQRIGVERIVGDLAVLTEGPEAGTPVVSVGAALLFGAEIFGK